MYNKVVLVGNLTRDIDLKHVQSGMAIAKTAIATSRKFKSNSGEQKEEVCFVDITFFGRSAEVANQYLRKGSKILVEGRLVFEQWSDQNGQKRSKHGVTVDVMQMLGNKNENENKNAIDKASSSKPIDIVPTYTPSNEEYTQAPVSDNIPTIDLEDEDIPF